TIFAGEKSASQGKVIDDADSFLLAHRLELRLVIRAFTEAIVGLEALVPWQARLLADFERCGKSIRRVVGSPDGPHFTLRDQVCIGSQSFLEWRVSVVGVRLIQVDGIRL